MSLLALSLRISALQTKSALQIGANLEGIADWSYSNVFADLVKQSRGFGPPATPWTAKVLVDKEGWPTQDFGIILATWPSMQGVGGTYKIRCFCRAKPNIDLLSSPGQIQNLKLDPKTGLVTADLVYPPTGSGLMLSFTNTNGGVRQLQVLRPGCKPGDLFTKPFLDHFERFSCLRFMDFEASNGNPENHWSDRTPPSAPSFSNAAGCRVPWEVCIALCNRLRRDAWINVPYQADDDYVAHLAKLVHKTLDPNLHVYVEYSNEVWNWGFPQATWNKNQAGADVAAGDPDLNYDKVNDANVYSARRIAKRIHTISELFRKEYGYAGWTKTVRPVLATQISWPAYWLLDEITFLNDRFGPPDRYLFACAGAPYFNLGDADKNPNLTKEDVLNALRTSVEAQKTDINMDACATLARFYNVKFVGYEGGSDTFGPNNIQAKKAASLDPAMQRICSDYLNVWGGYGFGLLNWFVGGATNYDSQYGTWGLTNDMTNQSSPKIKAIDQATTQGTTELTQGIPIPGEIDPRRFAFRDVKWQTSRPVVLAPSDWRGPYRDYLLRVSTHAARQIRLTVGTDQPGVKLQLWLNNALVETIALPDTAGITNLQDTPDAVVEIRPGMNVLRVKIVSGDRAMLGKITIG